MPIIISQPGASGGGGGSGNGNDFIPFDLRAATALNNLVTVEFRQNRASNRNYARRIALSGSNNSSDLYAEIQLPSSFTGFYGGNNLFLDVYSSDRANNTAAIYVYGQDGTVDSSINGVSLNPSADDAWETFSDQIEATGGVSYSAGDFVTIRVNVSLDSADEYRFARGYVRLAA